MQLTVFTDYGLRSLMYLAAHTDKLSTVREIADGYGISRHHMVKVTHRLSQLGYIEGTKGKGGGIRLGMKPEDINIWALVQALEPDFTLVECFDKEHNTCRIAPACGLKFILHDAIKAFAATLEQYSLADTLAKPGLFKSLLVTSDKTKAEKREFVFKRGK